MLGAPQSVLKARRVELVLKITTTIIIIIIIIIIAATLLHGYFIIDIFLF